LRGLQRGRSSARETEPVQPVARAVVDDTLALLRPTVADMVRLQLETGMRPGELVEMRPIDIDMSGKVWLYRPSRHKTAHLGHGRIIPLGPKAQTIILKYLTTNTQTPIFSPARTVEERRLALRLRRRTKVQPSQQNRRKQQPKKKAGHSYTVASYGKAVAQALARHNKDKRPAEHIPHWHPHQLRHLRALELKRAAGLDAARAVLGHRSPIITEHYATLDVATASALMAKMG
jgi:integrase